MQKLHKIDPKKVSPINHVKNSQGKSFLLIHSKSDQAIPYNESKEILQSIPLGNHKLLWLTEQGKHIHSYRLYKEEYERRVLRFLEKYLKLR